MKKLFFIIIALMWGASLQAQPWLQHADMNEPQKLQDIIDRYERQAGQKDNEDAEEAREKGLPVSEGKNYHFDRWVWYMQRHTDENGYIISPIKTWQEWDAYQQKIRGHRALFKTTGPGTNESQWIFQGPSTTQSGYGGIGRINAVAFHPTDSNTYWVGSAGGGAWKTTNDGVSWTSMTNSFPLLGVSDIDFNPLNPNTIYVCTGDRDASDTYSVGVLKSTDGGQTWQNTGLQWTPMQTRLTNCLVINKTDTNSIALATSVGLYKSNNGGTSWTQTLTGNFKQILYHPTDTNILYAAGTGPTGGFQIWRSGNGGYNWTKITSIGNTTRITMAVTPVNPKMVKAIVAKSDNGLEGIYNSSDTGNTFTRIMSDTNCTKNILNGSLTLSSSTCGGQGWYDLAMAISPVDSNKVFIGGVNTYYSSNGGKNWQMITQWYGGQPGIKTVHADKHFQAFNPLRPQALFECNDGGIYRTYNPTSTIWNDLSNGLCVTEFYRNAVSNVAPFVVGGAQDNGTKKLTSGVSADLTGGDGMNCEMDYSDPSTFYTATQYGHINRTQNAGGFFQSISNNIDGQPEGDWITPYILHPVYPFIILAGYKRIYFSYDNGDNWTDSSIAFSTSTNIKRISMSKADSQYIYVLVGSNTLRYSPNFNQSWNNIFVPYSGTISDILADPKDGKKLWITFSGYGSTKVAQYNTATSTWSTLNDSLPNIPVNCITIDSSNGTMYIGTDVAVFFRDTSMTKWALYSNGLPNVEVTDLGIRYTTKEIWAATYGRGMWKSAIHSTDTVTAPNGISLIPYVPDNITVAPNPSNGQFTLSTGNKSLVSENVSLILYNEKGQNAFAASGVFQNGRFKISATGLAKGIYILEVKAKQGIVARTRLVIL